MFCRLKKLSKKRWKQDKLERQEELEKKLAAIA